MASRPEVGRLRTVLLHRPGDELKRLTPRNSVELLFDGIPWLGRAQEEHDTFAAALRDRGVEVLYFFESADGGARRAGGARGGAGGDRRAGAGRARPRTRTS